MSPTMEMEDRVSDQSTSGELSRGAVAVTALAYFVALTILGIWVVSTDGEDRDDDFVKNVRRIKNGRHKFSKLGYDF